jgi:hypothetical protein
MLMSVPKKRMNATPTQLVIIISVLIVVLVTPDIAATDLNVKMLTNVLLALSFVTLMLHVQILLAHMTAFATMAGQAAAISVNVLILTNAKLTTTTVMTMLLVPIHKVVSTVHATMVTRVMVSSAVTKMNVPTVLTTVMTQMDHVTIL